MRLNGDSLETSSQNDEMLEAEGQGVVVRVADLERRVLEQGDELVCLKATLAEALRRITLLEGAKLAHQVSSSTPTTPVRNGLSKETSRLRPQRENTRTPVHLDINRRTYTGSSLPQRRAVHYQSTGSLHSDSQSSSSVSPIPSPSPRATPLPPTSRRNVLQPSNSPSNNPNLHKRWSSTGDFLNHSNNSSPHSKFSTKSFLNLYSKSNGSTSTVKHGPVNPSTRTTYNDGDRTLTKYYRGQPVTMYVPTAIMREYKPSKVEVAPSQRLRLDWVYGYRGRDCRSNLYFLPTGEMVYFVAAVVVLYNVEEQAQRHYLGHTDDVKSLAIHPNKMLIATGQCAAPNKVDARPHIRVWNSVSLHTQAVIGMNDFDLSVCCLSFSKADGGALLVAIDEAPDHNISVWDWQKGEHGHKITQTRASVDTIVAAEFHPLDNNCIVTCGKSHIAFWTLDGGGTLYKKMGIFEGRDKPKYVTCVAFLQSGDIVTGDSNGSLTIWARGTNTVAKLVKNVHEGAIFSICVLKDGNVISGGGKDGRIVQLDSNLAKTGEESRIEPHCGGVRIVTEGRGSQLLIGTTRNYILSGTQELGFQPIINGHTDEVWGLAANPRVPQFVTAGYDKILSVWDSMSHSILWSKDIGEQAQCVTYSSNGKVIAVGTLTGKWMVYNTQTRELVAQHTDGTEPISVIQYSPLSVLVAIGSKDNSIYIYEVSEGSHRYTRIGRCTGHASFVTHIDWALDDKTFRSNSDYEMLYWNAAVCRQNTNGSEMRDVVWVTNTCTISFTTVGLWSDGGDSTNNVNSCDRSHDCNLMVSGDDSGKVKLYSNPAMQPRSLCHVYGGHSSHVTGVRFLHDDSRLVSIGGKDTSILQWIVS